LRGIHMLPMPVMDWKHSGVRKILVLMGPAIFGVSVSQINLLLDTVIATFLPTGSVSWLYYSDRLSELPLGVFGIAVATVILPNLSRHHVAESQRAFSQTLDWALKMILIIAVPSAVALALLAEPLSLRAYAAGLIGFMLIKVLAPGFFARQDMRTPVRIGIIAMGLNMLLNLVLVIPLHSVWQVGHLGLAAATSISAFINALLLFLALRRDGVYQPEQGWLRFFIVLMIAVTLMLLILQMLLNYMGATEFWHLQYWWQRIIKILILCVSGFLVYVGCLFVGGFRLADIRGPAKATNR